MLKQHFKKDMDRAYQFQKAFEFLMQLEGRGYINDPNDPGGETKYGISKKSYPDLDIGSLKEEDAKKIYYQDYWLPMSCNVIPYPIGVTLFDTAVNQGRPLATLLLQHQLKVEMDGIIGPITISELYDQEAWNQDFIRDYLIMRAKRYMKLSHFNLYGRGWLSRLFKLWDHIMDGN